MTPNEVRALREKHGLTREQFGKLVWQTERAVRAWEVGERQIQAGLYELLLIKLKEDDRLASFKEEMND